MTARLLALSLLAACTGPAGKGAGDSRPGDDDSQTTGTDDSAGTDSTDSGDCTTTLWYADADADGYGDPSTAIAACEAPDGMIADSSDCDDGDAYRYPGAEELCHDGVVNDCDAVDDSEAIEWCSGSGPFSMAGADAELIGEQAGDRAGEFVARAGDVNGDLRDDLLVADPSTDSEQTTVYLVLGPVSGSLWLGEADARIRGDRSEGFAFAIAGNGDVNADGYSDVLVGTFLGSAHLFLGPLSGEVETTAADTAYTGDEDGRFGRVATEPGDTDGDGFSDTVVGAPFESGLPVESDVGGCATEVEYSYAPGDEAGVVYLFTNPTAGTVDATAATARILGEDARDEAGWNSLAAPGDVDGDGLADLYIPAVGNCEGGYASGAAYLVQGPVSGDLYLGDADGKIHGEWDSIALGTSLSGAGDTDGDGHPDLLLGDPQYGFEPADTDSGRVYLFQSPVTGTASVYDADAVWTGGSFDWAGWSISDAGDLDGDGFGDVIIGAPYREVDDLAQGVAYIAYGPFSGTMSLARTCTGFLGAPGDGVGVAVAGVGDEDADGTPDVLVSATGHDDGTGGAYLLLGGGALLSGDGEI